VIDDCQSNFTELSANVLPAYMIKMRAAMNKPLKLTEFCTPRQGVKTILKRLGRTNDFSGCYVLLRKGKPFYVGISRVVVARLRQHGTGKTHFDASLAYRMACEKVAHKMTRNDAMKDLSFRQAFQDAQRLLLGSTVVFIEIRNPLELHVFEAFCAMELDTFEWNTFRTH
jgi:predicted GIY-YIG superfamily endonuclease